MPGLDRSIPILDADMDAVIRLRRNSAFAREYLESGIHTRTFSETLLQYSGLSDPAQLRLKLFRLQDFEGEPSGDSYLIRTLGQSKLVVMLSDGMGSGSAAAAESAETLRLLWSFLQAGISRPLALETVNQQMLMRSGEELYATVDLCIIDLHTGAAELTKLAASRSLLLRGAELQRVEGGRLPLGILERVQPAVTRLRLRPGDTLVLGSDGVMEAGDGLCIDRAARLNAGSEPGELARLLVQEAALRRRSRSDDMTCVCVRIE